MKKLLFFSFLLLLALGFLFISTEKKVSATSNINNLKVTICHKQSQPWLTLEVAASAVPAHLAHGDSLNACPSVTPTVSPTLIPSPTITVTITPEPTRDITPSPTMKLEGSGGNPPTFAASSTEAPQCGDTKPGKVANINVVSAGERGVLVVQWALPSGANKAHIEYGLEKEPQHSLLETPNDGNEPIRELNSGKHYWFRVAGVNGCAVGDWSDWYDPIAP